MILEVLHMSMARISVPNVTYMSPATYKNLLYTLEE